MGRSSVCSERFRRDGCEPAFRNNARSKKWRIKRMEIEDVSMALEVTEILIGRKVLLQEGFDL
ncbi:MAG: hypothetical protein HUJ74_00990 [Lachnospiraceae bacterium]|nr:hypothetical protein [Lachnospiraceae bacterium]